MKDSSRISIVSLLALAVVLLVSTSSVWAQKCPPASENIAKAYGFDSFGQIDAIRYTFNLPIFKVSRTWTWEPKANRVTYEGKDKDGKPVKVTYVRSDANLPDNVKKEIDPGFINDNYWLVFPFHTCWDGGADVQDKGMQKLPIGKGSARQVVVKYPSDVGFTPGDTWELFVGADNRVEQFRFRHGGAIKPGLVIGTWEGYKKAGPLLFSTDHKGTADGKPFGLSLTNVAVKLSGSDKWIDAQ